MSIDYTIKAIPTIYNGRQYRSRLEARWAAYFDLLGWSHEYEPCDLGKWSPDFALWGRRKHYPVLVEVKPIDRWDRDTARKMADACADMGSRLLLVGAQPDFCGGWTSVGWLGESGEYEAQWTEALLSIDLLKRVDIFPNSSLFCQETILWEVCEAGAPTQTEHLWKNAANLVQWRPGTK